MKRICIVFVLAGVLILSACSPSISTAYVDELKAQVTEFTNQEVRLKGELREQAVILEDTKKQVVELEGQVIQLEDQITGLDTKVSKKIKLIRELIIEISFIPRDPSYQELKDFLKVDKTERQEYDSPVLYTSAFLKNAQEAGIRGYVTLIEVKTEPTACSTDPSQHWIFAGFYTEDGWIYVLPSFGREVKLEVGKDYYIINGFTPPDWGECIIARVMVIGSLSE